MKLLKLRFRNINSLAGDWEIDFSNPQFNEGLFALTGTTGAGKTSVLDAICLGFYGQTARQKSISKSENEVMTRGTGECMAEVEFEINIAQYRSTWKQHRDRKKAGGLLQAATRTIASLPDETIIAEKINDANAKIVELTGMDFEQFTRSVLLAQGQFDAFLKADDKARSDILEQVTGSEIYSKIGSVVFARFQKERDYKDTLNAQLSFITALSTDERTGMENSLGVETEKRIKAEALVKELSTQFQWLQYLEKIRLEIDGLENQRKSLNKRRTDAQPEFDRLVKAESARQFDVDLLKIDSAKTAVEGAKKELETRKKDLDQLTTDYTKLLPNVNVAAETAGKVKADLETMLPLLAEIREMDRAIGIAKTEKKAAVDAVDKAKTSLDENTDALKNIQKDLDSAKEVLTKAKTYLETHHADDNLAEILPSVETAINFWKHLKTDADKKKNAATTALEVSTDKRQKTTKAQESMRLLRDIFTQKRDGKDKAENLKITAEKEYDTRRPDLEKAITLALQKVQLTQRIANLVEHRKILEDGKPCPLCGSEEHPFALGNIPEVSVAQKEYNNLAEVLTSLETSSDKARKDFDRTAIAFQKASDDFKNNEDEHNQLIAAAEAAETIAKTAGETAVSARQDTDTAWQNITLRLGVFGTITLTPDAIDIEMKTLRKRQSEYVKQAGLAQTSKATVEAREKSISEANDRLNQAKERFIKQSEDLKKAADIIDILTTNRHNKFKGNTDAEEKRLRNESEDAERLFSNLMSKSATLKKQLQTANEELDKSAENVWLQSEEESRVLQSAHQKFIDAGFADEFACRLARMKDDEFSGIKKLQDAIKEEGIGLEAVIERKNVDSKTEKEKALTDKSVIEIKETLDEQNKNMDDAAKAVAELRLRLDRDNEIQIKHRKQKEEIDRQQKIFDKWNTLNTLIGGSNGEQFKRYAQGITLARLLKEANRHLITMTAGRYEMFWNPKNTSLVPSVIDRHQGDVERPVSNFSGGETFMVSLSLALGLANMASGRLHIDSLFLDEGFGTLDNQTLDIAINTLADLHQTQGKLIGVISHIEQMKSQIPTRIEIKKIGGGRSEMSGPGVRKIQSALPAVEASKSKRRKNVHNPSK